MNNRKQFFDISLAYDLVGKSIDQVLEQCAAFDPQSLTANSLLEDGYKTCQHLQKLAAPSVGESDIDDKPFFDTFDTHVGFNCHFELQDYQAFSYVGINFVNNTAVECIISLGMPDNTERYSSELEVTKVFLVSLEELYLNGRIQEGSEPGTRVYTWKKDNRTVISFVSSPPSGSPKDTGALLSVQIRDTQLHPGGEYFELLYNRAQKSVRGLKHVTLHRKDEPLEKVYEGRSPRYYLTLFLFLAAIGLGIGGIISLVSRNFLLGIVLIIFAVLCALLMAKLDSKARSDYRQKRKGSMAGSVLPAEIEISKDLYEFCRSCIYELAVSFNKTLSMGIEYEPCFEMVMDMLSVTSEQRKAIFEATLEVTTFNIKYIPYHKLSPLNQFITTIPGYVFYCLQNKLPDNEDLFNEAASLMENPAFPRYLEETIGLPVSQEVKGALWRPNILEWFRKRLLRTPR